MTYRELYDKAEWKLEHGKITCGEFDELTKPLDEEIRPHGEWIYHKEWELDGECAFECSKCGIGSDVDYDFCPNCGADMRGGEQNG